MLTACWLTLRVAVVRRSLAGHEAVLWSVASEVVDRGEPQFMETFLQSLLVSALLLVAELAIKELLRRFAPSLAPAQS